MPPDDAFAAPAEEALEIGVDVPTKKFVRPEPQPPPTEAAAEPARAPIAPPRRGLPPGAKRIGGGAALALVAGYLVSQPYADRAERRVAASRAEADRERYRPVEEARARVAQLDAEADAAAGRAALGTGAIWLTVGGALFAGWWRLTRRA